MEKGKNTVCDLSVTSVVKNTNGQTMQDSAVTPFGLQVFAWEDSSGGVRLSTADSTTGQVVINSQLVSATGSRPKCVALGRRLVVFYYDSGDSKIHYVIVSNLGVTSPAIAVSDNSTAHPNFDAVTVGPNVYLAYNGSSTNIHLTYFDPYMVQGNVLTKGELADDAITVFGDANFNIWVAYRDVAGARIRYFIGSTTLTTTVLAPTTITSFPTLHINNITGVVIEDTAYIFWDYLGSPVSSIYYPNGFVTYGVVDISGTVIYYSGTAWINGSVLQSRAWVIEDVPHVTISFDSALQATYFVANLYSVGAAKNIVAKINPGLAGPVPSKASLPSVNLLATNKVQIAFLQKGSLETITSSTGTVETFSNTGVCSVTLDFSLTNPSTVELGNNLLIGGGIVKMYDGQSVVEHGFNVYPEGFTGGMVGSGGSLSAGVYGYRVVYEWTDNQGQVHQSAPSPIKSLTAVASDSCSFAVQYLRMTQKANANLVFYRTTANGTVFFRLNSPAAPIPNITNTTLLALYTDTASDASLAANQQLYTTGGEVDNIAPPPSSHLTTYKNRVVLIPSDNPCSWWFSKEVLQGSPVEFSDFNVQNVATTGGPLTALQQLDDKLILFKNNSADFITGDGPAPSGANNDFSPAQRLPVDFGCTDAKSIVLSPNGLLVKSLKGIYLLTRSLSPSYIGSPVEAYNDRDITSGVLIPNTTQIRFTLAASASEAAIALVWDYFYNQWGTFTNINAVSACNDEGTTYTYLQPGGKVMYETPNVYTDDGAFIKLRVATSWLSLAGLQGFQRIYKMLILGQYIGPHQLLAKVAYDFNPIFSQQDYINATTLLQNNLYGDDALYGDSSPYGGNAELYQFRLFFERQKCQSILISLEDVQTITAEENAQGNTITTTINEGLSLSAIALEVGVKKGLYKKAADKSFG